MRKEPISKETILLVDNDQIFLNAGSEWLVQRGYKVLTTTCPIKARELLNKGQIDLAIIDAQMKPEDDVEKKNFGGVILAWNAPPLLRKIILTDLLSESEVRLALGPYPEGISTTVNPIEKMWGREALLQAVEDALPLRAW